jgi:alginate O-acetyltransferase complex protein AlgI
MVILGYYCAPKKRRNGFLLAVNLIFYGWGEPAYILIMLVSIAVNYKLALCIEVHSAYPKKAKAFLTGALVFNLGLLFFFKYTNFFVGLLIKLTPFQALIAPHIPLPAGISFYTFQAMSYVIDVYRDHIKAQRRLTAFGAYVSLFPQLIAGPIVRYKDIAGQLENLRHENLAQFAEGVRLFIVGMSKKVLLANQMGLLWEFFKAAPDQNGVLGSWLGAVAFTFQIYFDFSGYSDMACGLGKMFGFEFLQNFRYPYISGSVTEFWRRWHISLSSWFRDYVYIPLGGNRTGRGHAIFNLFVVWVLTGFWHGANVNFILWGIYYFCLLTVEKYLLARYLQRCPGFLTHIYTLFFVMIGWMIFSIEDLSVLPQYIESLFTLRHGFINRQGLPMAVRYLPLLLASAVACLPAGKELYTRFRRMRYAWIAEITLTAVALTLCAASLISQNYQPFLYFRF